MFDELKRFDTDCQNVKRFDIQEYGERGVLSKGQKSVLPEKNRSKIFNKLMEKILYEY